MKISKILNKKVKISKINLDIKANILYNTFRNGPVVQLVRTLACHARGRRFEPVPGRQFFASVAQSVEQGTENPRVDGSIPSGSTINADLAHPVERHLAKVEVASSSLVIRSIRH